MAEPPENRVFEVGDDGTVVPLFGPPPLWLRFVGGLAGAAVWVGVPLALFGAAFSVGGALSWDWAWLGVWLALGGFLGVWFADRAAPALRRPRGSD